MLVNFITEDTIQRSTYLHENIRFENKVNSASYEVGKDKSRR